MADKNKTDVGEPDIQDADQTLRDMANQLGKLEEVLSELSSMGDQRSGGGGGTQGQGGEFDDDEDLGGDSTLSTRFLVTINADDSDTVDVATGTWWHPTLSLSGSATSIGDSSNPYIIVDRSTGVLVISAAAAVAYGVNQFTLATLTYTGSTLSSILLHHIGDFWSI